MAGWMGLGGQMAMSFAQAAVGGGMRMPRQRAMNPRTGRPYARRRKRTKLSAAQLGELSHIKTILGKTAAANALPFYLK